MEWSLRVNDDLILDNKDLSLIAGEENSYFFFILIIILECSDRHLQICKINDLIALIDSDNKVDGPTIIRILIENIHRIYNLFQITNFAIYIDFYDDYWSQIAKEITQATSPVVQIKKKRILDEFRSLTPCVKKSVNNKDRSIVDRTIFDYQSGFKCFDYLRDDLSIFFDLFPTFFSKNDLNNKLLAIYNNLADFPDEEIEVNFLREEVSRSDEILLELSKGEKIFEIPFSTLNAIKGVNLIRLMKYWETMGYIEVNNWLGDGDKWNIKILPKKEQVYFKIPIHRENELLKQQLEKVKELYVDTYTELVVNKEVQGKKEKIGEGNMDQNIANDSIPLTPFIYYNKSSQQFTTINNDFVHKLKDPYSRLLIDQLIFSNEQNPVDIVNNNRQIKKEMQKGKKGGGKWIAEHYFLQQKIKNIREQIERGLHISKEQSVIFLTCSKEFIVIKFPKQL